MKSEEAKKLINDEIAAYENKLCEIRDGQEQEPVLLEGETTTGHYCQMMVDPAEAAPVLLRHVTSIDL